MANLSNINNKFIVTDVGTGQAVVGATNAVTGSTLTVGGTATFAGDVIGGTSKTLKSWRRLQTDANNDWGLNNNAGSPVIAISAMGTPLTSTTTFSGSITANTGSKITSSSADTKFSIETTSGTTIFPILDFVSSHSSAGARIRVNSVDVISLDKSQNSTFAGNVTMSQNNSSSDLINQNTNATGTSRFIAQSNTTSQNAQLVADDNNSYAWVGSSTGGANRVVFKDNTDAYYEGRNFGIGEDVPDAKLHVNQAVAAGSDNLLLRLQNPTTQTDSRVGIAFAVNAQTGNNFDGSFIQAENDGIAQADLTFGKVLNNTLTKHMVIEGATGNVGIGVTSPGRPLNVVSAYSAGTVTTSLKLATLGGYNGGSGTALEFGQDQGNFATWVSGKISSPRTGDNYGGSLTFSTNRNLSPTGIEEAMRIDNLGNVGIGTTYTPFAKLTVSASDRGNGIETQVTTGGGLQYILAYSRTVGATGYLDLALAAKTLNLQTGNGTTKLSISTSGTVTLAGDKTINTSSSLRLNAGGGTLFLDSTTNIILRTGATATERMRITSAGNALFGITNEASQPTNKNFFTVDNQSGPSITVGGHGGTHTAVLFRHDGATTPGSIVITTNTVTYGSASDYRLKEDLQDFLGLDMVSKIPVYDFKWKTDESRSYGVMAHELQKVLPQAVIGEKDAEEMQGVDYSKIVPLLIKSIQELEARIKILEK